MNRFVRALLWASLFTGALFALRPLEKLFPRKNTRPLSELQARELQRATLAIVESEKTECESFRSLIEHLSLQAELAVQNQIGIFSPRATSISVHHFSSAGDFDELIEVWLNNARTFTLYKDQPTGKSLAFFRAPNSSRLQRTIRVEKQPQTAPILQCSLLPPLVALEPSLFSRYPTTWWQLSDPKN